MSFTKIAIDKMADISEFDDISGEHITLPEAYKDIQRSVDDYYDSSPIKGGFERFQGKVDELDEAVKRGVEAGKAHAEHMIESGKEELGKLYEASKAKLGPMLDSAKESAGKFLASIKEGLSNLGAPAKDSATENALLKLIGEHPGAAAAAGGAAGVGTGGLISALRSKRKAAKAAKADKETRSVLKKLKSLIRK